MQMVEQQAAHRQREESRALERQHAHAGVGMLFGFATVALGLGATCYIAQLGHPASAAVIGTIDLAVMVGIFVRGAGKKEK